jgi:hypothetical protein
MDRVQHCRFSGQNVRERIWQLRLRSQDAIVNPYAETAKKLQK